MSWVSMWTLFLVPVLSRYFDIGKIFWKEHNYLKLRVIWLLENKNVLKAYEENVFILNTP